MELIKRKATFAIGMKSERGIKKTLGVFGNALSCFVLAALVAIAIGVMIETIRLETISRGRILLHRNLLIGFVAFFSLFIIPRIRSNISWLMKFNHEFTHLIFALIFFRRILRFKVDDTDSYVSYSSGWFGYHAITLSPYCVPIFTLALLPWHFTTGSHLYLAIIDILIGFSYSFHICTWIKQIRLSQTDIIGPGKLKSALCIILFQIINFCLITLTPSSGVMLAIQRVFVDFPTKVFALL